MTRDHIKSRASLKGEVWPERREPVEYGERETPWPSSHNADPDGLEPVPGEGSGFMMVASDTTSSGSPVLGLVAADSLEGSGIPSSDLAMRSGSKAMAEVGVVNPWSQHRVSLAEEFRSRHTQRSFFSLAKPRL